LLHKAKDEEAIGLIAAALIGQRDTPCSPAEQRDADSVFEFPELPRDRGLPNA
jgi:hypothetical protein